MSTLTYASIKQSQTNLNHAMQSFYAARKAISAYRDALQNGYHAKESTAVVNACNTCIERLLRMTQVCVTLNERLAYYERMRL